MARFKLLKHSISGPKGAIVEINPYDVQALRANGIIGEPVREPEVTKVIKPTVTKPARKKRARKSAN